MIHIVPTRGHRQATSRGDDAANGSVDERKWIEYYCKCNRRLPVQTTTTRRNPGKRFVICFVCKIYDFLDDDLLSEYYKEFLYGMFQKKKQLKKHIEYDQVINILALDKSMLEEELRAATSN
nr:calcium-binding EF-hand [Tanacetum cinerariifolium]